MSELINGNIINKTERNQLIYKACVDFGYSLSEISKALGMHYASISRVFSNERKKMLKYKARPQYPDPNIPNNSQFEQSKELEERIKKNLDSIGFKI